MDAVQEKSRVDGLALPAAGLLGIVYLITLIREFSVVNLLWFASLAALCWLLFRRERGEKVFYAFAAVAAVGLIALFAGCGEGQYVIGGPNADRAGQSLLVFVPALLALAGFASLAALAGVHYGDRFPGLGEKLMERWYLPALLFAVAYMAAWLWGLVTLYFTDGWLMAVSRGTSLRLLLWAAFALLFGMKVSGHEELFPRGGSAPVTRGDAGPETYRACPVAKLLFLCLITLGIWGLVWIWQTTAALNREGGRERKPLYELIFCLFLPFYFIYWAYKSAGLADGQREGSKFDVLCLVLATLLPPVAMMLIQDRLNERSEEPAVPAFEEGGWLHTVEGEVVEESAQEDETGIEVEIFEEEAPVKEPGRAAGEAPAPEPEEAPAPAKKPRKRKAKNTEEKPEE